MVKVQGNKHKSHGIWDKLWFGEKFKKNQLIMRDKDKYSKPIYNGILNNII